MVGFRDQLEEATAIARAACGADDDDSGAPMAAPPLTVRRRTDGNLTQVAVAEAKSAASRCDHAMIAA